MTIIKGCEIENCLSSFHSLFTVKSILLADRFNNISSPQNHTIDFIPSLVNFITFYCKITFDTQYLHVALSTGDASALPKP